MTAARAQDVTDPTLSGASRSNIAASAFKPNTTTSLRGVNHHNKPQIKLSGFDIVNDGTEGVVLLRGVRSLPGGPCAGLNDDALFLIHVAGRPGDADGNGVYNTSGGTCAQLKPGTNQPISDGNSASDPRLLGNGETVTLYIDRKCVGAPDLSFDLGSATSTTPTSLSVTQDDLTGHVDENLGGEGTTWEAGDFGLPGTPNYPLPYATCPAQNDGYYILRVPNWSRYFNAPGLNPGDFQWSLQLGSSNDVDEEDVIAGSVQLSQPKLSITKTPDLTLCPGAQGTYTIHVANDGNATVHGIVVTDVLPAGASIVTSSIPASGSTGTVTFTAFDLAQCEAKDITVTVKASDTCRGHDVNTASAVGNFASFCQFGNGTNQSVLTGTATANFDCKAKPCVEVTAQGPPEACPGQLITIQGTVSNCSPNDETILVTVSGQQALNSSVAAGVTMPWSFATSMPQCTVGQTSTFAVGVTGSNECGLSTGSTSVAVLCKPCFTGCIISSTIDSDFNGTAVVGASSGPAYIWFNSNLSVKGMTAGKSIFLTGSKVLINGVPYDVPDARITFAAVACATTTFDPGTRTWLTTVPLAGSDEIFISGLALPVTNLAAGAKVEWQGTFGTDQPGICFAWKWGAAAYKSFTLLNGNPLAIDYNAAQIKPTHQAACLINNGDHAGTPQNPTIRASVTGGARGGGGSNFTGSWSGTGTVCPVCPAVGGSGGTRLSSIALDQQAGVSQELSFAKPTPNPALGPSRLRFDLPSEASVSLRAYSVTGRMVRELATGTFAAGTHTLDWDLRDRNGRPVPAGVYFLRLAVADRVQLQSVSVAR